MIQEKHGTKRRERKCGVQAACFFVLLAASFSTACGEGNLPVFEDSA